MPLSDRDREVLKLEASWTRNGGAKEAVVRERFGLPFARYYQLVNALLDEPAAIAAMPVDVKRLRRVRAQRARASRRFDSVG